MNKLISLSLIAATVFAVPLDAQARPNTVLHDTGPVIIKGPIDCEHEKIRVCHFDKDGRQVCEWVILDKCVIV
jgi:hypothetical protein